MASTVTVASTVGDGAVSASKGLSTDTLAGIGGAALFVLVVINIIGVCVCRRRQLNTQQNSTALVNTQMSLSEAPSQMSAHASARTSEYANFQLYVRLRNFGAMIVSLQNVRVRSSTGSRTSAR
jgi:hypothetical protein